MQIQSTYTGDQWKQREEWYRTTIMALKIPIDPTTKQIMSINSILDDVNTQANFDMANVKRVMERAKLDMKNNEESLFTAIKQNELSSGNKVTEADCKGLVKNHLAKNPLNGYGTDIYTMMHVVMDRTLFMESVLRALSEKRNTLISDSAMLKIECQASGGRGGNALPDNYGDLDIQQQND